MIKTIFPTQKPIFDRNGNLNLPNDILFGGECTPKLKPREWFILVWLNLDTSECKDKKKIENIKNNFCGSQATYYRNLKKLKQKGFVEWKKI